MIDQLLIDDVSIPVNLFIEKRRGYRASFTKKGLNIRIPKYYSKKESEKLIQELLTWAKQAVEKKPALLKKYASKKYTDGSTIHCFDQTFTIKIQSVKRKTIGGKIQGDEIWFILPIGASVSEIQPAHVSKLLAKHYKSFLQKRLDYWCALFPKQYKTLRLKYNSSNWGSCSSKANINLSTRLLLCPLPVIDYVMVHELAHLVQANHSKSFWAEVARVMPDYKMHARWLKTHGSGIDF